jgi:hypothetical protein
VSNAAPKGGGAIVDAAARPDASAAAALIRELDLAAAVGELDMQGYTVVPNAVPLDLVDRMRANILDIAAEDEAAGLTTMDFGANTRLVWRVLLRGRAFEEAICTPAINALMLHLLGGGYRINVVNSSVLWPGAKSGMLHSDNTLIPDPFPAWSLTATAVIPCDDFTDENGSTLVVPGSHKLLRHPRASEGEGRVVAIEAPKGSLVVWNGSLWHQSGRRNAPGERVVFHANFCRLHVAAYETYLGHIDDEVLDRNPPQLRQMIGADLPWGFETRSGPDARRVTAAAQQFRQR